MWKRLKNEPNKNYFDLEIQLVKCMMKLNLRVGPVIMQITNSQKINISEMNTQNIPNSHVCSSDERKKMDKRERNLIVCLLYGR